MKEPFPLHMSPAQAAQLAGVSRWTIMRAIKSHSLHAVRDNKNQWKVASEDLDKWCNSTVRTPLDPHTSHTPEALVEIYDKLMKANARADVAEALLAREREALNATELDRDRWQKMAEALTSRSRRNWWPWSRN